MAGTDGGRGKTKKRPAGMWIALAFSLFAGVSAPAQEGAGEIDSLYVRGQNAQEAEHVVNVVARLKELLPGAPDAAGLYTRIGYLHLKIEEADSAAAAFRQALLKNPELAGAHVGLGRVFLEFKHHPKNALAHFQKAVDSDSTYAEAYGLLARAYLANGDAGIRARQAAGQAIRHNPGYAPAYLLLAQIYQKEKSIDAAMVYYKRYLDLRPDDQDAAYTFAMNLLDAEKFDELGEIASRMTDVRGLPLLARARMHMHDYEGALTAFRRYLDTLDSEEQALYEDISLVGSKRDVRAYRATSPDARKAFLRRFWLQRDLFKTSGGAMRRAEHHRRVWHARRIYGQKKWPWDRRGEIYIRYGEPDYRSGSRDMNARVPLNVQSVQETMAFQLYGQESLQMTFVGPVFPIRSQSGPTMTSDSYTPAEETVGILGWKPVTAGSNWSAVPWEVWIYVDVGNGLEIAFTDEFQSGIYDFAPIPNLSAEALANYPGSPLSLIQTLSEYAPATRVSTVADNQPERYSIMHLEPLTFFRSTAAFRGTGGQTEFQVDMGIPIDSVIRPADTDTTVIVERRVALFDSRYLEVRTQKQDLAIPISDQNRGRGRLAVGQIVLHAPPGEYTLATQAWRKGTNMTEVYHDPAVLPDFRGDGLMLSGLVVAQQIAEASASDTIFVRGNWRIVPWPPRQFRTGEPLFLYFEIYNLTRDDFGATRYQISYEIQETRTGGSMLPFLGKLKGKSGEAIGFSHEETGMQRSVSDYVALDLSQVKPGRYAVKMSIKDLNSGQTASRETEFWMLGPSR